MRFFAEKPLRTRYEKKLERIFELNGFDYVLVIFMLNLCNCWWIWQESVMNLWICVCFWWIGNGYGGFSDGESLLGLWYGGAWKENGDCVFWMSWLRLCGVFWHIAVNAPFIGSHVASGPIENCHLDLDYGSNKMTAFGLGTLSAIFESWRTILQIKKN
jgi:hypothetical protein